MLVNITKCLTNIQASYAAGARHTYTPGGFWSFLALDFALKGGYLDTFTTAPDRVDSFFVGLRYLENELPAWKKFAMFSTPSRSVSLGFHELRRKFASSEFLILSTHVTRTVRYLRPNLMGKFRPSVRITGLLRLQDVLAYRIGGQLLFIIY
jgi:ribosomal protein S8